ncbi:ABC transporter permease [Nocardia cerradoensis]|uniref:Glutathione transport system permease protein GsiC n=1 Tax=Nocardia cerradoensis TaxID=85688 RepID=A0A231GW78_9NOCA|nr:ABC transporter permease [Nocardia cerradoensis]NKY43762.1 ABC transporter permease [Nocardia cerradoensis]OXR40883.1 Glutathione transport system permease protein GsiC [Nocardia cerradoensis]
MTTATTGRVLRLPLDLRYLGRRVLTGLLAVWGAITLVFFALYSSGNPAIMLIAPDAPAGELERVSRLYGFDRPLPEQYARFLLAMITGDFPKSLRYNDDPLALALNRLVPSATLGAAALLFGIVVGGAIGYVAATSRSPLLRRLPVSAATVLDAIPGFFLAVLLVLVFSVSLHLLPSRGSGTPAHLVLPALTLGIFFVPSISRVFRTALVEVLDADHVRTARAKGLHPVRLTLRHIVGNSLGSTLNVLGIQAGVLLGGAVVTESIFSWPGVGQLSVNAVQNRDYPLVIACVLVIAVGFVVINLVVDILAALFDPRIAR